MTTIDADPVYVGQIKLAQLAKALGHPAGVRILQLLLNRDACCGEIVDELPLAQATDSHSACARPLRARAFQGLGISSHEPDGENTPVPLNDAGVERSRPGMGRGGRTAD